MTCVALQALEATVHAQGQQLAQVQHEMHKGERGANKASNIQVSPYGLYESTTDSKTFLHGDVLCVTFFCTLTDSLCHSSCLCITDSLLCHCAEWW